METAKKTREFSQALKYGAGLYNFAITSNIHALYMSIFACPTLDSRICVCGFDEVYHNNFTENSEENKFAVGFNWSNINQITLKY